MNIGVVTAQELFEGEDGFEVVDNILTFTRNGKLSYLMKRWRLQRS